MLTRFFVFYTKYSFHLHAFSIFVSQSRGKISKDQRKSIPSTAVSTINPQCSTSSNIKKEKTHEPTKNSSSTTLLNQNRGHTSPSPTTVLLTADAHVPLVPNFVSNSLTITPVSALDVPKPPPKIHNRVEIINIDANSSMQFVQKRLVKEENSLQTINYATDHSITHIMASPPSRPISVDSSPVTSPVNFSATLVKSSQATMRTVIQASPHPDPRQWKSQTTPIMLGDGSSSDDGVEIISTNIISSPTKRSKEKHLPESTRSQVKTHMTKDPNLKIEQI